MKIRHTEWIMIAALACAGAVRAVDTVPAEPEAATPPPEPAIAASLHEAVDETVGLLDTHGLALDPLGARAAVIEAIARRADPSARLFTAEDYRRRAELADGIAYDSGIRFTHSNRFSVVVSVVEGSSADEAGIEPGDIVSSVAGADTTTQNVIQVQHGLRASEPGRVEVEIQRDGADPVLHQLDLRRAELDAVEESLLLPAGLGYIRVNGLFREAGDRIAERLLQWKDAGLNGIVLDLRSADGLDLDSAVRIGSLTAAPNTLLFSLRDAEDRDLEVYRALPGERLGMPLMILVDEQTRGAAEGLAASLSGSGHGAMLIGRPSAGDPMIREPVTLSDGSSLYLATRRLVVASGKVYRGTEQVRPDIVVSPGARYPSSDPVDPILTDRRSVTDAELENEALRVYIQGDVAFTRAVDVLLGLKALNLNHFDYGSPSIP